MSNVRLSTVLIFILSISGCSKSSPEIPNNMIIGSRCEKPKHFTLVDVEVEVHQRPNVSVVFGQALGVDRDLIVHQLSSFSEETNAPPNSSAVVSVMNPPKISRAGPR